MHSPEKEFHEHDFMILVGANVIDYCAKVQCILFILLMIEMDLVEIKHWII